MIVGQVTAGRDAIIRLPVKGSGGNTQTVDAIVDTGFSEYLTLPASVIASLALPLLNATAMTVAGGSVIMVEVYEAAVVWNGQDRTIKVHSAEGDALIGMGLMYGCRLTVDVVDGGTVAIEAMP